MHDYDLQIDQFLSFFGWLVFIMCNKLLNEKCSLSCIFKYLIISMNMTFSLSCGFLKYNT